MRTHTPLLFGAGIALWLSACAAPSAVDVGLLTGDTATGGVRGFVYGDAQQTPAAGVSVSAAGRTTTTAALTGPHVSADQQFDPAYATATIVVPHDFGDGAGAVDAERRLRATPLAGSPDGRYVYLRRGEYFLEQLPPGSDTVSVSACGSSASETVAVSGGRATPAHALTIDAPAPVMQTNGAPASVYAASLVSPASITATVGKAAVQYDASDATVQLRAWPGASGCTVDLLNVTYVYADPYGEEAALPPVPRPIAPVAVPAATHDCYGAPVTLKVPIAYSSLSDLLLGPQPPLQVLARVQFVTHAGDTLQSASQSELTLSVPIARR